MSTESSPRSPLLEVTTAIAGVLILLFLGILLNYLLLRVEEMSELGWTRAIYLLSGVEAVAFAAAGYFFGKEVNRKRAENAEEATEEAQKNADTEAKKAKDAEIEKTDVKARVNTLALSLKNRVSLSAEEGTRGFSPLGATDSDSVSKDLDELIRVTS